MNIHVNFDSMWDETKLNQYIADKVEEDLHLDYKAAAALGSSDPKKMEMSKDVSAFANSDGGTIIYGISEDASNRHLPGAIDPIDREAFTKETLERIINSRIAPRINGIVITPVTIGSPSDNKVVYIVDIPKGNTAHQANDKKYYRRFNFEALAMEDWEIKDIINRQTVCDAKIVFEPRFNRSFISTYLRVPSFTLDFDIRVVNTGRKVIQYCDCYIVGNATVADTINPTPPLDADNLFELVFTNEQEHKIPLDDSEHTINIQRLPIAISSFMRLGAIKLSSEFFINNYRLKVVIGLDDNRIVKTVTAKEIIEFTDITPFIKTS